MKKIKRYFKIPDAVLRHNDIMNYWECSSQFIITYAARRSFKTEIAKRRAVNFAITNPNKRILIGASQWSHTKAIYWDDMIALIPKELVKRRYDSELRFVLWNGSRIELFSGESAEKIEGQGPAHMIVLDECEQFNIMDVFNRTLLPIITDAPVDEPVRAMFLGVPRTNQSLQWRDFINKFSDPRQYPNWSVFTWSSEDILTAEQIAFNRAQCDPRSYQVEYMGQFVDDQSGKAYYNFNEARHIVDVPFNRLLPVQVSFDYNVGIMSPQFTQRLPNGIVNVVTEVTDRETNVFKIAPLVKAKLAELYGSEDAAKSMRTTLYGDPAGFSKTANGRGSAWDELKSFFRGWNYALNVPSHPKIDARISAVNSRLMTADQQTHMVINPSCKELILDFKHVSMDDLTVNKHKQNERTHSSDAIGYFINAEYPLRQASMTNG